MGVSTKVQKLWRIILSCQIKINFMKPLRFAHYTLVGLHDADGTYTIRCLTNRVGNSLGFTVLASFSQATLNKDVLSSVEVTLDGSLEHSEGSLKTYSFEQKTGLTKAGETRKSSRTDVNFTKDTGKNFLNLLKSCPPLAAGKRRDLALAKKFRITQKHAKFLN